MSSSRHPADQGTAFTPSVVSRQPRYTLPPINGDDDPASSSQSSQSQGIESRCRYFIYGSTLDTRENRNAEFKAAQGEYIYDILPQAVAKYGCAFANGEGGTLYLGIQDDGVIIGVHLSTEEETWVLRSIQKAFNGFLPKIPSHSVRLVPLTVPSGIRSWQGYKVIEITVQAGNLSDIYETKDHKVFIKRDGSIELQNALQIKDLAITKYKQMLQQRT